MSAPTTWAAALDDWEGFLDEIAAALESGDWETLEAMPPWQRPADLLTEPSAAEELRLLALADRAGRLRNRLEHAMAATAEEIGEGRSRHRAAVAYLRATKTVPSA